MKLALFVLISLLVGHMGHADGVSSDVLKLEVTQHRALGFDLITTFRDIVSKYELNASERSLLNQFLEACK